MARMTAYALVLAALTWAHQAPAADKALRMEDFLRAMADLDDLPRLTPGVTCKQWSSYDRASVSPNDLRGWTANSDAGNYLRSSEEEGNVCGEMGGPGCIARIWSANPQGQLQIYLDGDAAPTIDVPFADIFSKDKAPYPFGEPISYRISGAVSYLPIPYRESCKIVIRGSVSPFYHFDYLTFPKETDVEPFSWDLSDAAKKELARLASVLKQGGAWYARNLRAQQTVRPTHLHEQIAPGQAKTIYSTRDNAVIRGLELAPKSHERQMLRKTMLRIYWDLSWQPSVDCPIGDFFGTSFGENLYDSSVMGMNEDYYYCYFPMPFESARIEIENQGTEPVAIEGTIWKQTLASPPDDMGRFFAKWRREITGHEFDYPLLETNGRGKYVGTALYIDNPTAEWWGEGDEKVWIDGEKFPSTYGTGSEDYFGDAWGLRVHVRPFEGCTRQDGPGHGNKTCAYRWHIADAIPFSKSYRMTIENYDALGAKRVDYASVAYWYQALPVRDFFASVPVADRIPRKPTAIGAVEAEEFAEGAIGDVAVVSDEDLPQELCGGKGLRLSAAGSGGEVVVPIVVQEEGTYDLGIMPAPGIALPGMTVSIGGRIVGKIEPTNEPRPDTEIGRAQLKAGANEVTFRFTSPTADGKYTVIVDAFYIRPAQ